MFNEIKLAYRSLYRRPGPGVLAIMALALGIGLVTLQFSFVNAVMLKGLPFPGGDRICHVQRINPKWTSERGTPVRDFLAWREQQSAFEGLGAYVTKTLNLSGQDRSPQRYRGAAITANLLTLLRQTPRLGRALSASDEAVGSPTVVLLGYAVWQRDFGGKADVLGQSIRIDGDPATIVGVMPDGFQFPAQEEMWTNLRPKEQERISGTVGWVEVVGRLKPGVSLKEARSQFGVISTRLSHQWPDNEGITTARIVPFVEHFSDADSAPVLLTMLVMGLGVLLIACTNVATLLLAQTARRTRELAVRAALGASRGRLITQMLIESTAIAICGAGGGLLLAYWGSRVLQTHVLDGNSPFWWVLGIDAWVLAGAILVTVAAGVICGLLPALQGAKTDVNSALKDEGLAVSSLRLGRFNRFLVTLQVAVSCALLVITAMMAKTVVTAKQVRPPFATEGVLTARLELLDRYFPTPEGRIGFGEQLLRRLRALPGVTAASLSNRDPVGSGTWYPTETEGESGSDSRQVPAFPAETISAYYFQTLQVALRQGRGFDSTDKFRGPGVAIVNESFAQRVWPNDDPLGKRLRWLGTTNWLTVVGVAPNLCVQGLLHNSDAPGYYLLQEQQGVRSLCVLVRTQHDPKLLAKSLAQIVSELAPDQPVYAVRTLKQAIADAASGPNTMAAVFALFGGLAVFLAGFGIYGVISFTVAQRTREFGIRLALGAQVRDVLRLVMLQGLRHLMIGLAIGLLLAVALTRPLAALLFNVSPWDPLVYASVIVMMVLVTGLAVWMPARRAAGADPLQSLRQDN